MGLNLWCRVLNLHWYSIWSCFCALYSAILPASFVNTSVILCSLKSSCSEALVWIPGLITTQPCKWWVAMLRAPGCGNHLLYPEPRGPGAAGKDKSLCAQWLWMQAVADSWLRLFALSLCDPGCSDGHYRNISNTQEQLYGEGLLCSVDPYPRWTAGIGPWFTPLQHQLREESVFLLTWIQPLVRVLVAKMQENLIPLWLLAKLLLASQDLLLGPYPGGELWFWRAGEEELPFLGSKGPSGGTEKGTGLQDEIFLLLFPLSLCGKNECFKSQLDNKTLRGLLGLCSRLLYFYF